MKYFIVKSGVIIASANAAVNEADLAERGEILISTDEDLEIGWVQDGSGYKPPLLSHEDQRKVALARVDKEHANYLVMLSGGATVAERDTWKVKEEAARAFEAGTASAGQAAMLSAEAQGAGITVAALAATIIAKSEAFLALIGVAAGLRAQGRAAVLAATDDAVPLDQVEAQIEAVFVQLAHQVQAAITQLQTPTALNEGGNNHA